MAGLNQVMDTLADEPMVDEKLGQFEAIRVPVTKTGLPAHFVLDPSYADYLKAQTQEEHNALLNTFYPRRQEMPDWKERGQEVEKEAPKYTDRDSVIRKGVGVTSSVVDDIAYDKDKELAYVKMNGEWHNYNASPEQFRDFLSSGSLGRELSNIRNNKSTSMSKAASRLQPTFKTVFAGL